VPAVVDLASMRKALAENTKKEANTLNPQVPVELVIDHSIIVDKSGTQDAIKFNEAKEFQRNKERFELLKWA
jgi:aconitate hydratase